MLQSLPIMWCEKAKHPTFVIFGCPKFFRHVIYLLCGSHSLGMEYSIFLHILQILISYYVDNLEKITL